MARNLTYDQVVKSMGPGCIEGNVEIVDTGEQTKLSCDYSPSERPRFCPKKVKENCLLYKVKGHLTVYTPERAEAA
jgi:hypothetical protein